MTLKQYTPARAEQVILTDEDLERVMKSKFYAEEKMDGARYKLHTFSAGNRIDSRRQSVTDGLFVEKTACVPHIANLDLPPGWVLDTEIIARHGVTSHDRCANTVSIMGSNPERALKLQEEHGFALMNVFDVLVAEGRDVRNRPLEERLQLLNQFMRSVESPDIQLMRRWTDPADFPAAFKKVTAEEIGEGLIIKDLTKPYGHPLAWYKYKWHFEIDVIATGTVEPGKGKYRGTCGAVYFGLVGRDNSVKEIGKCSGMDDRTRDEIYQLSKTGHLRNRVFECRGWEVTRDGKIRNANFKRWRPDKNWFDCTVANQLDPVIRRK